jgi:hypothetical protein
MQIINMLLAVVIPFALLLCVIAVTRSSWLFAFLLSLAGPILANILLIALVAAAIPFGVIGQVPSFQDFLSLVLMIEIFVGVEEIFPRSLLLGCLVLLSWSASEKYLHWAPNGRTRRLALGVGAGIVAGLLFAAAVFVIYQTPLADLGNRSGFTNRYRPGPWLFDMSILTGAIDGILVAYFSRRISPLVGSDKPARAAAHHVGT